MLSVTEFATPHVEFHQLRRLEFPGILRRDVRPNGRIVIGGIHLDEGAIPKPPPCRSNPTVAPNRGAQAFGVLHDSVFPIEYIAASQHPEHAQCCEIRPGERPSGLYGHRQWSNV